MGGEIGRNFANRWDINIRARIKCKCVKTYILVNIIGKHNIIFLKNVLSKSLFNFN